MSRFKRLADLRRIREESHGMAYARVVARKEGLRQDVVKLDKITEEERYLAQQAFGQSSRLPSEMVDDFVRGQAWRRQRLEKMIATTQEELVQAKEVWHAARVQLKQAEKLAEKEALQHQHEADLRERKTMDMIGIMRNRPFSGQEGAC